MLRATVLLSVFAAACHALTCYENDAEGNVYEITNSTWTYCSLIPFHKNEKSLFGVGPEDEDTDNYDPMFSHQNVAYRILTLCVFERYDFRKLGLPRLTQGPEFMFRCLCNYDRCNSATTFAAYLSALKADSL